MKAGQGLWRTKRAKAFTDWRILLAQPDVDIVLVATQHHNLAEITRAAIDGKARLRREARGTKGVGT